MIVKANVVYKDFLLHYFVKKDAFITKIDMAE